MAPVAPCEPGLPDGPALQGNVFKVSSPQELLRCILYHSVADIFSVSILCRRTNRYDWFGKPV